MTNDTTTLNGALRELGETMAANLTTQGVASTWDEGLTTLAGKILDIQGGGSGYDGISLTGDKSILSAADSEYVTLTAQLMNGQSSAAVSGETVSFKVYKASDDTLIDTLTDDTDSTGLATVSYYGQGTGDLYIKSSVDSIISSEIYVEDCFFYRASGSKSFTSSYNIENIVDINSLTGDYEISATLKSSAIRGFGIGLNTANTNENKNLLRLGYESGNNPYFTRMSSGSVAEEYKLSNTQYTANTDVLMKITKINGVYTGYIDTNNHTINNPPSNLRYVQLEGWNTSKTVTYTDFKVKPL